ncbi:MAG: ornithine carbamoyltransferase [Gemmatimonadetes bacterium]|nr:ornithine carbamoyltransferase [Gemmatimonadota bacterium]
MRKDFLSATDLTAAEYRSLFALAGELRRQRSPPRDLAGRTLAMIFEKPSLRTRVTFEAGMTQLGGHAVYLAPADIGLGSREPVADVGRNLERWVDLVMARTFAHVTVEDLAASCSLPVVNALSDLEHPCQSAADFLTLLDHRGSLDGLRFAYVGDGNNVCHSLLLTAALFGAEFRAATPAGYGVTDGVRERARVVGAPGFSLLETHDPAEAVRGADAVYTDVWTSMGQEAEAAERRRVFAPYQVNAALLELANSEARVMHCLPAHRGEEITPDVLEGPRSVVFDQAENRLHVQKALLLTLFRNRPHGLPRERPILA